ncbi:MAG: polymer-forming cytoskeletal protein [Lachnospiraceae bacterium]|nr:polymer-forming cytoskeletal protein [Lachnospiraceae bacterium]
MLSKKSNVTLENSNLKVGTIVGEGAIFQGNLVVKDTVRVDGEVKGDVKTESVLIIGSKGRIDGNIEADTIFAGGLVKGDLRAKSKTEISPTGKIFGDITTKTLVIDENAVFQGRCDMGQSLPENAPNTASTVNLRVNRDNGREEKKDDTK